MADAYTTLWTNDLCKALIAGGFEGERQIRHVVDGEPRGEISVHGIYRLAPESASALHALISQEPASA
ncbi:hypothetical protein [Streptomyces yerevanensis]|uniref:hypothetical protein n=1 Tax=Streptomyces yerevanensis TaxID=66378 RepID=UPI000524C28D|nr:hypothetical protein [Streptomyces yerevanensis]